MTLGTALRQGTELLDRGGIEVPHLTAGVLLAHAVHCDRTYLYAHPEQELREVEWIHYGRYLHERLGRKPTQYITRQQEFYGRPFRVSPDVLIPRPETEHLIEIARLEAPCATPAIDVGTGSGAIAITLALEAKDASRPIDVIAADISRGALAIAAWNAQALGAAVTLVNADGLSAFADGCAGLIISNPPYVALADRGALQPEVREWEPDLALFAGLSGLDFYRRLVPEGDRVLKPGGSLIMELGAGQSAEVLAMLGSAWERATVSKDLQGIERVLHARKRIDRKT